jgi:hypothetical protein
MLLASAQCLEQAVKLGPELANTADNVAIGERLAAACEAQRLTQVEFAERLDLSPPGLPELRAR